MICSTSLSDLRAPFDTEARTGFLGFADPHVESQVRPVLEAACFDCHGESGAEANVNLEAMVAAPEFSQRFKSWELVAEMIREKRMPPQDMPQPSDAERHRAIDVRRSNHE